MRANNDADVLLTMKKMILMTVMAGVSQFPEQPAAAESDAGGEVAVHKLSTRTGGSAAGRTGPPAAEGARGSRRQGGADQSAHGDRVLQGAH